MKIQRVLSTILLAVLSGAVMAGPSKRYDFKVLLDDKEIGHHHFVVSPGDTRTQVTSEARFNVKFLFISVYSYLHSNTELWQGDCLRAIDATTDDNGELLSVQGEYSDQHLLLRTSTGEQRLDGCIRTFAYWDPELLDSDRLLNAQTGEIVPVETESLGEATIEVRGERVLARHYRINNHEFDIDLWYSTDQEWLALESTTETGGRLRYLIQ